VEVAELGGVADPAVLDDLEAARFEGLAGVVEGVSARVGDAGVVEALAGGFEVLVVDGTALEGLDELDGGGADLGDAEAGSQWMLQSLKERPSVSASSRAVCSMSRVMKAVWWRAVWVSGMGSGFLMVCVRMSASRSFTAGGESGRAGRGRCRPMRRSRRG